MRARRIVRRCDRGRSLLEVARILRAIGGIFFQGAIVNELQAFGRVRHKVGEFGRSLENDGAYHLSQTTIASGNGWRPVASLEEDDAAEKTSVAGVQRSPRICSGAM